MVHKGVFAALGGGICGKTWGLVVCSPPFGPPEIRQCYTVENLRTPSPTCAREGDMSHPRAALPLGALLSACLLAAVHAQHPSSRGALCEYGLSQKDPKGRGLKIRFLVGPPRYSLP